MMPHSEFTALNALNAITDDVLRDRWLMSMEMLASLYETLRHVASLVHETMNSRCPINKLPPEILGHVFSMVPSPLLPCGYHGISSAKQTYDLILVSHVCRRWRDVALGTPSLWSTLCESAAGHSVSTILHARAQQAPLVVHLDRARPSAILTGLLGDPANGARVTELHLHDLRDIPPTQLSAELLAFPAPRLERAVVRRHVGRIAAPETGGGFPKPIVEMFSGITPSLRSLVLHDVPFLPSNWFDHLTHLRLSFEASPIYWTLPDLLQLLSQAPMLADARLAGLSAHLHSPEFHALPSVTLPCLGRLEIGGCRGQENPTALMRTILSHLILPAGCAVRLYGIDAQRLSPSTDVRLTFIEQPTRIAIDVTFTTLALTGASVHSAHSLCMELNTAGTTKTLLHQSIEAFLASAPASVIREVTIASQRVWPSWCDPNMLLSVLSNTKRLTLGDAHLVDEILDALRPSKSYGADLHVSCMLCPSLELLHIPFELTDLLIQKLRAVLAERAQCGLRMQCTVLGCQL